jgi:hypothetical protein
MPRGGHRDNAGRKSEWVSSSKTRPIRVPDWMADKVLDFAQKLDSEEIIDNVQNQNSQIYENTEVKNIRSILQDWNDRASGKETSPRWKNVSTLIEEISEVIKGF